MKWMAGWLLNCTSICRLTVVHSSRGVFDVTSARANRTLQVQSERNRIADESTWRGRMAWAWFRSIPYRSSSMMVANIYSYPGKLRQRNSVFPFCTACYVDSICSFSFQFLPSYLSSMPLSKAASRQLQCYIITASMQCLHCTCYYFIDSSFANIIGVIEGRVE